MKMFLRILLSCILMVSQSQQKFNDPDLESIVNEIFVTPKTANLDPTEDSTDSTQDCVCVPYYNCNDNGTVITNGMGIIDIRIQSDCDSYLDTCCKISNTAKTPTVFEPQPTTKTVACGHRNADGVGFRITGNKDGEAQYGEFPWMVAILREEEMEDKPIKVNVYQCGGALIHKQVVLTAAHCVIDKNKKFKIRAGEWDTQTRKELYPHQDEMVEKIDVHPDFYSGALHNDIALLYLKKPVEIAENVNVVCLPPQNAVIDNARCFASGWGKDVFGKEGKYQVILKKVELPIVPRSECQRALRTTRLGRFFQLHESFVCAGGEAGKDTCKGDGGSPLVCPVAGTKDVYQQVGIVAWGIGCGQNQIPGVYVNVAMFRNWIDERMADNNFETNTYNYE